MSKLRECLLVWRSTEHKDGEDVEESWNADESEKTFWNVLAFDGVLEETHTGSSTVTSYPIDRGFLISDSVIKNNRQMTLNTVTSNISYKVSVRTKDFDTSFTELLSTIGMAREDLKKIPASSPLDRVKDFFGKYDGTESEYKDAQLFGRAKYDNDSATLTTPFGSITTTNPIATTLTAQVVHTKVDEVFDLVDKLNAYGIRVHVITLRGVKKDCVITGYSVSNNKNNAFSAPMAIELTQMTVFETKTKESASVSSVTSSQSGQEATDKQADVVQTQSRALSESLPNPSPMSYFAAGFAFRGIAQSRSSSDYEQNPVRYSGEPLELGDKQYYEISHQEIQISTQRDFFLSYKGVDYVFGKVVYNDAMDCYTTSLAWSDGGKQRDIGLLPLTVGNDLVSQYGTNFESLVVVNTESPGLKIRNIKSMKLMIIEDYEQYYL